MHLHWLCLSIHVFKFVKDKSKIITWYQHFMAEYYITVTTKAVKCWMVL